ncbi:FHA domain-containing protein [Daejeonella lutea]|uniref:FHA domain-containing protein n=1 Tax=Daejeonella lutea TaxID=572036 RepID=A0A1T5ACL6_9SPHI|nr:FHA domain-containing protein [Daejeonella lutea]SKB32704.1 FHA domain-containing protein [Daejeonella lutea]
MFDIFKGDQESKMDVKASRDAALRFIKEELQKLEGGEGKNIRGLQLFVASTNDEKHVLEAAMYVEDPDKLKEEIQKIADDFDIELPLTWTMEVEFVDSVPAEAKKASDINLGLFVKTRQNLIQKDLKACIRVLNGEAEKEEYTINSGIDKVTIGREKAAQGSDGFFRVNNIAFPGDSSNEANKYISRQHAHISWNSEIGSFMIFADEGGVPPNNKIKIKSLNNDTPFKLNSTQIGHVLREGDQVILGESAVIEFRFLPNEIEQ